MSQHLRLAMIATAAIVLSSPAASAKNASWAGNPRGVFSLSAGTGLQLENVFREGLAVPVNLRAAAWAVVTPNVQLGGFVGYRYEYADYESPCPFPDEPGIPPTPGGNWKSHSLIAGGSGRFGAAVTDSSWIGFNLDLGIVAYLKLETSDPGAWRTAPAPSAYLFPALVFLYLHPLNTVSIGFEALVGFEVVVGGRVDYVRTSCDTSIGTFVLTYGPTAHLGLALGF